MTKERERKVVPIRKRVDFRSLLPPPPSPELELRFAEQQARREALGRREQRQRNLDSADELDVTDEMREALIQELPLRETPSLVAARNWAQNYPKPCLMLCGGTGCGKTLAAAWILTQLGGLWISAARITRVFAANFGDQFEEQDRLRSCRLLFVDDIGTETDAALMKSILLELLEQRKSMRRRTVFTTNMPAPKFLERYQHERIISRLHESVLWSNSKHKDMRRP